MTEEEYTKLKDGVEFYLHDNRGNYFVFDKHHVIQKQSETPNFAWKFKKSVPYGYALEMRKMTCYQYAQFFIDANQRICSKWLHKDDELCYGFACCGDYHFSFPSSNYNKKKSVLEPVFVELIAPCVLK